VSEDRDEVEPPPPYPAAEVTMVPFEIAYRGRSAVASAHQRRLGEVHPDAVDDELLGQIWHQVVERHTDGLSQGQLDTSRIWVDSSQSSSDLRKASSSGREPCPGTALSTMSRDRTHSLVRGPRTWLTDLSQEMGDSRPRRPTPSAAGRLSAGAPRPNPLWGKGFVRGCGRARRSRPRVCGPTVAGGSGSGLVRRAGVQDVSRSRWTTETFLGALPGPLMGWCGGRR